jgi:acyl-CoA thioesterase-1
MNALNRICLIFIILSTALFVYSQNHQVRIAFVGNSITIGTGLPNPEEDCYPSQFADMLDGVYGDICVVRNFAVSGRTMLKNGDYPIWDENSFTDCWNFAPDICFILLGTNDSKPQNWDVYGDEFIDDYLSMIDTFKVRNALAKFIVCYPPPAYEVVYNIRDSVILHGVIPAIDSVLNKTDAELLDFYNPLLDSVYLFPDMIHPDMVGAGVMAEMVFNKFIDLDIMHGVR